jgi:hypothetical protein
MNQLFVFAGDILFLAVSVIIFPVMLLAHTIIGCWMAFRYVRRHKKAYIKFIQKQKESVYHFHLGKMLVFHKK